MQALGFQYTDKVPVTGKGRIPARGKDGSVEVFICMPGSAVGYALSMFELEFAWRNSMAKHEHMSYWPQRKVI